ncbi:MAG TPA: methyltransferase domain-containing protein [Gemmataceae bacterium]|nr:methyltransferase domain-containing protein [Gemmataceae bacterium]
MVTAAEQANQAMVDRLIAEAALWSCSLIASFRATPRHRFLDRVLQFQRKRNRWHEVLTRDPGPEELEIVYSDRALTTHVSPSNDTGPGTPISSSSQPSLMAQMLEDLKLTRDLRTLEIGAGTGYNAALLAHVVGPGMVTSIDVDRNVLSEAWDHLRAFPERGVELKHADGRAGYTENSPFDRIMVTAATPDLEPAWLEQLSAGGLLLAPLALAPGLAYVVCGTVRAGVFHGRLTRAAYFMPLRAEGKVSEAAETSAVPVAELRPVRAPWAGWFDRRRPRTGWLGFIQSVAFYGLLRGLEVHYQTLPNGETTFGISDGACVCWLGANNWYVTDDSGRHLGWALWRAFLEAGGPRPTEFLLQASPGKELAPGHREGHDRQGLHCRQRWEKMDSPERLGWL